jgi:hypothetical protein
MSKKKNRNNKTKMNKLGNVHLALQFCRFPSFQSVILKKVIKHGEIAVGDFICLYITA